jgi:hypothetical protein
MHRAASCVTEGEDAVPTMYHALKSRKVRLLVRLALHAMSASSPSKGKKNCPATDGERVAGQFPLPSCLCYCGLRVTAISTALRDVAFEPTYETCFGYTPHRTVTRRVCFQRRYLPDCQGWHTLHPPIH